jgi:hypothetical protein
MKSYEEMIQFVVYSKREGNYRYQSGPMAFTVAVAYDMPLDVVLLDISIEEGLRDKIKEAERKAEHKASNEARRLANLAKKV